MKKQTKDKDPDDYSDIHVYEPIAIFRILKTKDRGDVWQQQWMDRYSRLYQWRDVEVVNEEDGETNVKQKQIKDLVKTKTI